jgi:23S rRNA (pseudouridine1915-N3)-methyltransferase
MKFRLLVIGRPRDRTLATAIAGYEERAARYWPLDVIELREETGRDAAVVRRREGERLLAAAVGCTLVVCDERGESLTSTEFADCMQAWRDAARDVALVVGGAHGLSAEVRHAAARQVALAAWTLPHELARLVLVEQLYRAGTIVRREPYHK